MSNRLAPQRCVVLAAVLATSLVFAIAGSAQASTLPTVTVAVSASSVTVGGALQSGGVNVVATATGVKEASVILFLVKPGVSLAEVETFAKEKKASGDPNTASKYGSIVFDTEVNPGPASEAQTDLQPGQYLVLTGEGEKPVQPRTSFVVRTAASPAVLPTPQATVRSIEFGFRGPSTLHDGELVRFENEGFLVHMDIAFPVKNKTAARRVVKALLAGQEKGLEKLVSGPPTAFAGPRAAPISRRRSRQSRAGTCRRAS